MKTFERCLLCLCASLAALCVPAYATVNITAFLPSLSAPQLIGTPVTWEAAATDTNSGPVTFQFNVAPPGGSLALVKDFNVGPVKTGVYYSQPFIWVPTGIEGVYQIQVVIKDFTSGETASQTASFTVDPLVTGSTPVAVATANALVALFSAPSCPAGSTMRVSFQQLSRTTPPTTTGYINCHPPNTMTFEIAGMYPSTIYNMFAQTNTGGTVSNGPTVSFTTGTVPSTVTFPSLTVNTPAGSQTDTADSVILQNVSGVTAQTVANVATDLSGNAMWYYAPGRAIFLTRPLSNATMLTIESGESWNPLSIQFQLLRQIDLEGNIIKETNLGVLSGELLALGATDAQMCDTISSPAPVGAACLNTFHHDAIQTLPNGNTAVFVALEKIFPAGTQGNTSGLPVDIIGDMIVVLDANWQAVWYFDAFEHDSGAPQLDINRAAVLGETCTPPKAVGCPTLFLTGPGIAPSANDWLHGNSLYYWPQDNDIVWSSRNQDWVMKIDYNNGAGTGDILWRMGPCGDFTFNNIENNPWPWNSHQHDFGIQNSGVGPATLWDNGNTRYSAPGASTGCMQGLGEGYSRGMALTLDETTLQVTPVLSVELGVQSLGDGSAQLLSGGNYGFLAGDVVRLRTEVAYILEVFPTADLSGTEVLNIRGPQEYRMWRMPSLYDPPIT